MSFSHAFNSLQDIAFQYLIQIPFQNIAECLDFIAGRRIVNIVCYKEEPCMTVHLPEQPGHVNAVLILAFIIDIQKSHVALGKLLL